MRAVTRTSSFFGKWVAEVLGQPGLILTLIVGPFLVMFAFGEGVQVRAPRPRTLIVDQARQAGQEGSIAPLPEELTQYLDVVGTRESLPQARRELRAGEVDVVVVIPEGSMDFIERGDHVPVQVLTDEIDPVARSFAEAYLRDQVAELNRRTIEKAVAEAQLSAGDMHELTAQARQYVALARSAQGDLEQMRREVHQLKGALEPLAGAVADASRLISTARFFIPGAGRTAEQMQRLQERVAGLQQAVDQLDSRLATAGEGRLPTGAELDRIDRDLAEVEALARDVSAIPPEVLSAPFQLEVEHIAPFVPTFTSFYAPAVLTLLVQHLAITLAALSMTRIRLLRVSELLRAAPVRPSEVVLGNYLSYALLCGLAAAGLLALMMQLLGVPVFGPWPLVVLALLFLVAAALGVGFVVSILSSSEQQAAQVSMLILLAAIFFSGFVFSLDRITWPVRAISYVLPSTYAVRSLQDVMLRGVLRTPLDIAVLAIAAVALFALTIVLLRREFRPD